ncbi:YciI family protein [Pseudonocardia lacus]|uniref:YciI family protein n=1 Tax=Pseudonocardia lacus TaxID=2835865 RepID=UPI001BDC7156|nr:YciI family protein [Pseudonocardia lacus]
MATYLLSVQYPAGRTQPAPEELEVIGKNVGAVRDEMVEAGVWVFGGGLAPAGSATVVEARGDDKLITDGPFAEGKELLGGLSVIDVPDLDAAIAWAEKQSRATTVPIEVRPFLG